MDVIPLGMVTLVMSAFLNASLPIAVTFFPAIVAGITTTVSKPVYLVITPLASTTKSLAFCAKAVPHRAVNSNNTVINFFILKLLHLKIVIHAHFKVLSFVNGKTPPSMEIAPFMAPLKKAAPKKYGVFTEIFDK
jgi:hypothetical protein